MSDHAHAPGARTSDRWLHSEGPTARHRARCYVDDCTAVLQYGNHVWQVIEHEPFTPGEEAERAVSVVPPTDPNQPEETL